MVPKTTIPQKIVIIDWSMIGDLVMLSPCVRAIAAKYPDAHLAILGQPASIAAYKHHPDIDELIPYDRSKGDYDIASFRKAMTTLKRGKFDLAYIFHNSFGSALMAALAGVKQRVGYRHEYRDLMLTRKYRKPEERMHLIEEKANLLRQDGIELSNLHEEHYIDEERAASWLREKLGPNFGRRRPIIAVGLGATREYKQWAPGELDAFLNSFAINSVDFVFIGAPGERHLFADVYSYNNTVVDLVGQTTIEELSWVLDHADLYVGTDSGPMHLAVGRGTPVVAIFGPTQPNRCGPLHYERAVVLRSERICNHCERVHGKHVRQCAHEMKADQVYAAALELLEKFCDKWTQ